MRSCPIWGRVGRRLYEEWGPVPASSLERFRDRVVEGARIPIIFSPWRTDAFERTLSSYRSWLARLYAELRAVTGANVIVDSSKNASYARILQATPGVHVNLVHLVRDSRGVANSLRKRKRRPGTNGSFEDVHLDRRSPLEAALFWSAAQLLVEGIRDEADGYRRVRYRDFIQGPVVEVGRVLELVGDRVGPADLEHIEDGRVDLGPHHVLAGNPMREDVGTIALKEDVSWRRKLGVGARGLVSILTWPLLKRYGYSPT